MCSYENGQALAMYAREAFDLGDFERAAVLAETAEFLLHNLAPLQAEEAQEICRRANRRLSPIQLLVMKVAAPFRGSQTAVKAA